MYYYALLHIMKEHLLKEVLLVEVLNEHYLLQEMGDLS